MKDAMKRQWKTILIFVFIFILPTSERIVFAEIMSFSLVANKLIRAIIVLVTIALILLNTNCICSNHSTGSLNLFGPGCWFIIKVEKQLKIEYKQT